LTPAPRRAGVFLWGKPQTLPRALVARLAGDEDAIWRAFDEITGRFPRKRAGGSCFTTVRRISTG
jgi:hypothetical protein